MVERKEASHFLWRVRSMRGEEASQGGRVWNGLWRKPGISSGGRGVGWRHSRPTAKEANFSRSASWCKAREKTRVFKILVSAVESREGPKLTTFWRWDVQAYDYRQFCLSLRSLMRPEVDAEPRSPLYPELCFSHDKLTPNILLSLESSFCHISELW